MSDFVVIRKGEQRWEMPADHQLLPEIRRMARFWGIQILDDDVEKAAPTGTAIITGGQDVQTQRADRDRQAV